MAVIGNLATTLSVNSAGLTTGLAGASKSFTGFASSIGGVTAKLGALGAAITGVAGAAGFGLLVKSSFSTIDALAKVSDKLGETTEHIAGLRHAAELSGVGAKAMDTAMQRMTRRLAEAARGGGEARGALQELGLDAQALASAGPAEAFREITRAMQGVENQGDRVRLAFKFFDTEGVGLVNTMTGGVEGLNAAMAEARALGLAPTREEAARIEAANDAITRMKSSFTGIANEVAIAVAPTIERVATGVTALGMAGRQLFSAWSPAISGIAAGLNEWGLGFGRLIQLSASLAAGIVGVRIAMAAIITVQRGIAAAQTVILALSGPKGWATLAAGAAIGLAAYTAVGHTFDAIAESAQEATQAAGSVGREMQASSASFASTASTAGDASKVIGDLRKELDMLTAPEHLQGMVKLNQQLQEMSDAGASASDIEEVRRLTLMRDELQQQQSVIGDARREWERLNDEIAVLSAPENMRAFAEIEQSLSKFAEAGLPSGMLADLEQAMLLRHELQEQDRMRADQQSEREKLQSRADSLVAGLATPFDNLVGQVREIRTLFGEGLLSREQAEALIADAQSDFMDATSTRGPGDLAGVGALQRGSSEAFSAVLSAMRQDARDPQEMIAKTNEEQVKLQQRIARALERSEKKSTVELVAGNV